MTFPAVETVDDHTHHMEPLKVSSSFNKDCHGRPLISNRLFFGLFYKETPPSLRFATRSFRLHPFIFLLSDSYQEGADLFILFPPLTLNIQYLFGDPGRNQTLV